MNKETLARWGVLLNVLLFGAKLMVGLRTGSTAVLSDALNSLLDVFAYSAIHISVKLQEKAPDENHPFGHRRAEPLAGLIIAIFAAILGAAVLKEAGMKLLEGNGEMAEVSFALPVMFGAILTKLLLAGAYWHIWRQTHSFGMRAGAVDSCNDVLVSTLALAGLLLGNLWDGLAGLMIGVWVLVSGIRIGLDSIGFLMGSVPDKGVMDRIRKATLTIPGVVDFNDLRAHFVGDRVHVEIHIEVDDNLSLRQAHNISLGVRYALQDMPEIDRAFIHIDPVHMEGEEKVHDTSIITDLGPSTD